MSDADSAASASGSPSLERSQSLAADTSSLASGKAQREEQKEHGSDREQIEMTTFPNEVKVRLDDDEDDDEVPVVDSLKPPATVRLGARPSDLSSSSADVDTIRSDLEQSQTSNSLSDSKSATPKGGRRRRSVQKKGRPADRDPFEGPCNADFWNKVRRTIYPENQIFADCLSNGTFSRKEN